MSIEKEIILCMAKTAIFDRSVMSDDMKGVLRRFVIGANAHGKAEEFLGWAIAASAYEEFSPYVLGEETVAVFEKDPCNETFLVDKMIDAIMKVGNRTYDGEYQFTRQMLNDAVVIAVETNRHNTRFEEIWRTFVEVLFDGAINLFPEVVEQE